MKKSRTNFSKLIFVIIISSLIYSCQKPFLDPNPPFYPVNYDPNAKIFVESTGVTDTTQINAINNFVIDLKNASLWPKFKAIYPMVGGSLASIKWNLVDSRDLDAAFRLTFYGSPVVTASGVLFPTLSDYADTHLADTSIGGAYNSSISYYSTTQNTISGYDMGCIDSMTPYNELSIYSNTPDNSEWFGFSQPILSPNTTGLFMLSASATNATRYRNGVIAGQRGAAPINIYTDLSFLIGRSRVSLHNGQRQCALVTIGNGFSDSDAQTFYNIVQKFETSLGR
jgi:hypothetical protein